jgi:D-proline reductase (dithiol) PrdB
MAAMYVTGDAEGELMKNSEALQRSYNVVRSKWDSNFEWVVNDTSPWTPVSRRMADTSVALVSTCGAYVKGTDIPFDAENYYGDPSYREIPRTTRPEALAFAHTHYNHVYVDEDPMVGLPLSHMLDMEGGGIIGCFVDPALAFMGYLPQPRQLVEQTAPAAAKRLLEAGAQAALLIPC